ncbi:MAG: IclR family transcriptional regulator [Pseudomonadota bacterium]
MDDLAPDSTDQKDRNFVVALARGLEILRCFGENEPVLTNSEISDRTGLPKATVSRLTHTLCALEYLAADSRAGAYRLSAGVLHLGFSVLAAMDIGDRAKQEMRKLRDGPNSYITVALAEQHQLDAVYLATSNSREGVTLAIRVGSRLPLFSSAIGRAILVGMSPEQVARVFELARSEGLEAEAHDSLAAAREEYATFGFCRAYGSWRSDVNGIAVPVHALAGGFVYGLNVGGPAFRVKPKELEAVYAPLLIRAAKTLSAQA